MAKLLLIEDDDEFAGILVEALSWSYSVDRVGDGLQGLAWLRHSQYDAAVIDWELPLLNGIEVCKQFRGEGGTTPILLLTARPRATDQIVGLDAGADDYLNKPFESAILHARLRALLRRAPAIKDEVISIGRLSINTRQKVVSVDQQPLRLTKREFAILELLMTSRGEPVAAETILNRVWPSDSDVSPDNVRCHITRIRAQISKLSKEAAECVQSAYGIGYLVKAPKN